MGVTGLWTVLQPCARPIKIETLNKKRLAVDASIWIYQFLKAVRDKEGNALRNSHIVGFFRRVCKLLFIGIKPVFVFDGGAPALKRQTIQHRKSRREGRREDAVRTAGKLLAIQMQRAAEDEDRKRKETARRARDEPRHRAPVEEEIPENLVYAEELLQTKEERVENRSTSTFKRKDQYHLPDLGRSMSEMGATNDPRVMSLEELEEYARHFDRGEDINVYDFSKIDFDGVFFQSLPAADRYNILNAARLRSRLRMGHSKEQLDAMFPDRMAFSKFQIERVRERNDLTQRLMNLNGMNDDAFGAGNSSRVAGERDREYVLVKNDGVEGGWALGVVQKDEGTEQKPIVVDKPQPPAENDEAWEDDDEFEDVPIEGLNRLPKLPPGMSAKEKEGREFIAKELATRRRRFYNSRKDQPVLPRPRNASPVNQDPDSLFLAEDSEELEWENVTKNDGDELFQGGGDDVENDQLQQAIALSMQPEGLDDQDAIEILDDAEPVGKVFQQKRAVESNPFAAKLKPKGLAAVARMANQHSSKATPTGPFEGSDSDEDDMDLQAALAESRNSKRPMTPRSPLPKPQIQASAPEVKLAPKSRNAAGFDGPLPFEKLNLGNSLLGKKKMEQLEADTAGGFEKNVGSDKDKAIPLPPWFNGERDIAAELTATRQEEKQVWEQAREEEKSRFQFQELPRLRKEETTDVIDLDASACRSQRQVIALDSEDEDVNEPMEDVVIQGTPVVMGDVGENAQTELLKPLSPQEKPLPQNETSLTKKLLFADDSDDEPVEWSESEPEEERAAEKVMAPTREASQSPSEEFEDVPMLAKSAPHAAPEKSPSPEFEEVQIGTGSMPIPEATKSSSLEFDVPTRANQPRRPRRDCSPAKLEGPDDLLLPIAPSDILSSANPTLDLPADDSDQYSDPEDEELFASLAQEASEHARFAQELNATTTVRVDFDKELKQLRAQQKKDRRDADEVTQTMISECQQLLTLFGLPYITAPMEAEAQCAELVSLGLVDGIVTDDSDTFLFGGTRVYKNMFNAAKYVECYLASDLVSSFHLSRDKLISIAQLLGSDYTPGIPGIGPVTALEILSEFPSLEDFTQWWTAMQSSTQPPPTTLSPFLKRFRKSQATKLFLPPSFPDPRVADAYLHPDVDSDPEPFAWGVPDLAALRAFLQAQIGWSQERTDEVLVPVIRDMNRRAVEGTQSNITRFFEGGVGVGVRGLVGAEGRGKGRGTGGRMGAALARLAGNGEEEKGVGSGDEVGVGVGVGEGEGAPGKAKSKERKKTRTKKTGTEYQTVQEADHEGNANDDNNDDNDDDDEAYAPPPSSKKRSKPPTKPNKPKTKRPRKNNL